MSPGFCCRNLEELNAADNIPVKTLCVVVLDKSRSSSCSTRADTAKERPCTSAPLARTKARNLSEPK